MLAFLATFFVSLPFSLIIQYLITTLISYKLYSFLLLHLSVLFFCRDLKDIMWLILTIAHGAAHIVHPAFHGLIPNKDYVAIYDYIIHAMQCLTVYMYEKDWLPIGIFFSTSIYIAGAIAYIDRMFMATTLWILLSGGGVFGTIYHMMIINRNKNPNIHRASIILWSIPFVGYLIPDYIPQWDFLVNSLGLFNVWYFNHFITINLYNKFVKPNEAAKLSGDHTNSNSGQNQEHIKNV